MGYLEHIKHTSNDLNYLKNFAPNYHRENKYQTEMYGRGKDKISKTFQGLWN